MTFPLSPESIERLFIAACDAELAALKPGNVHRHAAGHGMEVRHFEDAARAAAPFVADRRLSLGARIEDAVKASFAAANCNTNLGILLLCVPLATAADDEGLAERHLDARLAHVLDHLTRADAEHVFRAIVAANPAGLGRADQGDVAAPATHTLREAMAFAATRDRIANAYVTNFADLFEFALPKLYAERAAGGGEALATSRLHMALLAEFPDSHIVRKHGLETALCVQSEARETLSLLDTMSPTAQLETLAQLDASLKSRGLNPGTTADFVVATHFADLLVNQTAISGSA